MTAFPQSGMGPVRQLASVSNINRPAGRFTPSSARNPCPVCGRTHDGDCRVSSDGVVYCHTQLNGVEPGKQHPDLDFVYCGQTKRGHLCGIWKPLHLCTEKPQKTDRPQGLKEYSFRFWDGTEVPVKRFRLDRPGEKSNKGWRKPGLNGRPQVDIAPYRWHVATQDIASGDLLLITKGELKAEQLAVKEFRSISILDPSERLITELRSLAADGIAIVLCPDNDLADLSEWYAELTAALPSARTLMAPMRGMDWRFPPADGGLGVEDWINSSNPNQDDIIRAITDAPWEPGAGVVFEATPAAALATVEEEDLVPADQALLAYWGDGWRDGKNGQQVPTKQNAGQALTHLREAVPASAMRLNVVSGLVEVNGCPFEEADLETFYAEVQAQGWDVTEKAVKDPVVRLGLQHRFDPIREYLNYVAKAPDIEPVDINSISTDYLGTDEPDFDLYMKIALLGAVKRRFEPGCQFDTVVTLDGDGRIGKSAVWIALASPDWHTSSDAESEKDFLLILHQAWIYEQAELDYLTGKRAVGQLKNLITTRKDTVRAPYGKGMENRNRQGIMVGTVNGAFLQGDEALRGRFLVIQCPQSFQRGERIDFHRIAADRDRIWKAAVLAYRDGDTSFLNPKQLAAASNRNLEGSEQEHIWFDPVSKWLRQPMNANGPHTTDEILIGAGIRTLDRLNRSDQMELARCMQQIGGWAKDSKATRHNGRRGRFWRNLENQVVTPGCDT